MALVPIAAAAVATILFVLQGGFGGGHGDFDAAIVMLGVPASLLMLWIPVPEVLGSSDLALKVLTPALVNWALWRLAITAVNRRRRLPGVSESSR